jgi:hypothetical protein
MALLITKAYSLASHPQPTREELLMKAKDWADFLHKIVPENRLTDVLAIAFEGKASGYLLSAHDMRNGWLELLEGERAEQERIRLAQPKTNVIEYRCLRCFDTGAELVYLDDGTKLGARPGCRHYPLTPGEWLYKEEKRISELAMAAENGEHVSINNIVEFNAM